MGSGKYAPWTTGVNPLRKYGGLGTIITIVIMAVVVIAGGVPEGLDRLFIAGFLVSIFYFGTLYLLGTFRDFDREAYPLLLGIMAIPLAILLLLVATGMI